MVPITFFQEIAQPLKEGVLSFSTSKEAVAEIGLDSTLGPNSLRVVFKQNEYTIASDIPVVNKA
ncbi:hypothetical protein ACJX0J_026517, partial [Zea mays]